MQLEMCALQLNGIHEERLDVFEVKIEESEKAGSHWEYNPGHLACAASALPLSYNNWHSPPPPSPTILYIYCTGGTEVPQSHTRQPLSICRQNFVRG